MQLLCCNIVNREESGCQVHHQRLSAVLWSMQWNGMWTALHRRGEKKERQSENASNRFSIFRCEIYLCRIRNVASSDISIRIHYARDKHFAFRIPSAFEDLKRFNFPPMRRPWEMQIEFQLNANWNWCNSLELFIILDSGIQQRKASYWWGASLMTSQVMSFAIIRLEARVRVPSASGVVNLSFFFVSSQFSFAYFTIIFLWPKRQWFWSGWFNLNNVVICKSLLAT